MDAILLSVISMLSDPNCASPANIDASNQFKDNYDEYKRKVLKLTQQSMEYL